MQLLVSSTPGLARSCGPPRRIVAFANQRPPALRHPTCIMAETDWAKLKVVDLKAELKRRDLPQHGLKAELVARLTADDEAADAPKQEDVGQEEEEKVAPEPPAAEAEAAEIQPQEPQDGESAVAKNESVENGDVAPAGSAAEDVPEVAQTDTTKVEASYDAPPPAPAAPATSTQEPQPVTEQSSGAGEPSKIEQTSASVSVEPADINSTPEAQKRKRRSASPPPTEEAVARKRARAEDDVANGSTITPAVRMVDEPEQSEPRPETKTISPPPDTMAYERTVAPALHPATSALYINNLMRPLRPHDMRAHLVTLAATSSSDLNDDVVIHFHLDQIRTHAFVVFDTTSAASRVRNALHDCVWPNESNRKALWVDFVPPEKVEEWIDMEEKSGGGGRTGSRWEVVYEDGPDGSIEARLESGAISASRPGPPPSARPPSGPAIDDMNAIPLGPRGQRDAIPPTGPRAIRPGTGPGPRPPPTSMPPSGPGQRTQARPSIAYTLVSEDLARRRIDNMRGFYSPNAPRDLGREINRYSFEDGDTFVDRGKEIFEGIRPPHRERAVERERRGGRGGRGGWGGGPPRRGGGGPPYRPRSDRYLPALEGAGGRGDDRRQRYEDDARLPRYPEEREPVRGGGGGGGGGGGRGDYRNRRW